MVTISANKGDRLRVVAHAWHCQDDSAFLFLLCLLFSVTETRVLLGYFEWWISFPPYDVDMTAVRAGFGNEGKLTIEVLRRRRMY